MSRSERWSNEEEIHSYFPDADRKDVGAGPIVEYKNGKKRTMDGEAHIGVFGMSGFGKTSVLVLPTCRQILLKNESFVLLDPKADITEKIDCYIPSHYQKKVLNLRFLRRSKDKWNPLSDPYRYFKSKNSADKDIALSMLDEFCKGLFPVEMHSELYWSSSGAVLIKGLILVLFEYAPVEYINIDNVIIMMTLSESRRGIGTTLLQVLYDELPNSSLAKRALATYVSAPNETRASIHSVAENGLSVFHNEGLMELLSEDTLMISDINVDVPFALTIIVPDETDEFSFLVGLLVTFISQYLIRAAHDRGGKLRIRCNFILEELGSVGRCIPSLPNLMVAGRSRNIRMMLILQSREQLTDIYGKSKAETILSCVGLTVGFSTSCWHTLEEWSQRCGECLTEHDGVLIKEPLITPNQLQAMPVGTCLILARNGIKFITHLPFYNEMYDNSDWKAPEFPQTTKKIHKSFDFSEFVNSIKNGEHVTEPENITLESWTNLNNNKNYKEDNVSSNYKQSNVYKWRNEDGTTPVYETINKECHHVYVVCNDSDKARKIARLLAKKTGDTIKNITDKFKRNQPVDVVFYDVVDAIIFKSEMLAEGATAWFETRE